VKKLFQTFDGHTLPIVVSNLYRKELERPTRVPPISVPSPTKRAGEAPLTAVLFGENRAVKGPITRHAVAAGGASLGLCCVN